MWAALLPLLGPLLDRLVAQIPDPAAQEKAKAEFIGQLVQAAQAQDTAQMQVNAAEAASGNLFVSGWRPAVGWLCVIGLGVQTILYPLAGWALSVWSPGLRLPQIDTETLLGLLVPMLGIGGFRTLEKLKGASR